MEKFDKGKDFFQPFFLDSRDRKKVFGAAKAPPSFPFLDDRPRNGVGNTGEVGNLSVFGLIQIQSVADQEFLPERQGADPTPRRRFFFPCVG